MTAKLSGLMGSNANPLKSDFRQVANPPQNPKVGFPEPNEIVLPVELRLAVAAHGCRQLVRTSEDFDSRKFSRLTLHKVCSLGVALLVWTRGEQKRCLPDADHSAHLSRGELLDAVTRMRIGAKIRWLLLAEGLCLVVANSVGGQQMNAPADATSGTKGATDAMERTIKDAWVPPDIDTVRPPVAENTTCSLQDVISKAAIRVEEFVDNLNRVTAMETIQSQAVNRSNTLRHPEVQRFEYVVSTTRGADGNAYLDEYRGRNMDRNPPPTSDNVAVSGAFSALLIFHPYHTKDFQMMCEGLGTWHGQPAWQIRFQEQSNHMHALMINDKQYLLTIRGRAWILADSYQVGRVEIDLVNTIREIHLRLQHEIVEYSPQSFPAKHAVMWVPSSAELYMDFRGHRFYRRHSYTDFQLFSVKVYQEFGQIR